MKSNLSSQDFINLCHLVAKNHKSHKVKTTISERFRPYTLHKKKQQKNSKRKSVKLVNGEYKIIDRDLKYVPHS